MSEPLPKLTERQAKFLQAVAVLSTQLDRYPYPRDVALLLGLYGDNALHHVRNLVRKGYIGLCTPGRYTGQIYVLGSCPHCGGSGRARDGDLGMVEGVTVEGSDDGRA